jgi:hypothetical protein
VEDRNPSVARVAHVSGLIREASCADEHQNGAIAPRRRDVASVQVHRAIRSDHDVLSSLAGGR